MANETSYETAEPVSGPSLALALGLSDVQADALLALGRRLADDGARELSATLGQGVQLGDARIAPVELGALDSEGAAGLPIAVRLVVDGQGLPAVLMLPQTEIQALLPDSGSPDLPNLQALSDLLGGLANRMNEVQGALRITLSETDADAGSAVPGQSHVRLLHSVRVEGHSSFIVSHLIPSAALQGAADWVATHGLEPAAPSGAEAAGAPAALSSPPPPSTARATAQTQEAPRQVRQVPVGGPGVYPVQFSPLEAEGEVRSVTNLELLLDVPLRISVEIGRTERTLKEVLDFGPNSVVPLDKLNGEPMDIYVNERRIARGEVVVLPDEKFAVRVTEIMSPAALIRAARER